MRRTLFPLIVTSILLAMTLVLMGCGGESGVTVTMNEYSFEPERITVRRESMVTLILVNDGSLQHSFDVPQLDISSGVVEPGETKTIEFQVGHRGRYKMISSVPGDEEAGMVGQFIVSLGAPTLR